MALVDRSAPAPLTGKSSGPTLTNKANNIKGTNSNDLSNRNYIRWDAEGVEKIPPGEDGHIQAVIKQIDEIQEIQHYKARHC